MKNRERRRTLDLPPALVAEVEDVARQESRTPCDLIRRAVERYLKERRWRNVTAYGQARARELGLTEADLPRLIAEARQERRRGW